MVAQHLNVVPEALGPPIGLKGLAREVALERSGRLDLEELALSVTIEWGMEFDRRVLRGAPREPAVQKNTGESCDDRRCEKLRPEEDAPIASKHDGRCRW